MKRKVISLILAGGLALGMLTGCGNNGNASGSGDGGAEGQSAQLLPEDDASKEITFSVWTGADDYKHYNSYAENPVVRYLNKKFNITMEFQQPPMGTEMDNLNVMLGTGDYTDVINTTYSTSSQSVLYEDGVIIDIAPYLETYMPNYYKILQEDDELRKLVYDDEGHAYGIYNIEDLERNQWGGMVYRRDILDVMTGGNIAFPSGNEEPVTVEDWEYMLPLIKMYFDNSGMAETATLIIPACGYIQTGELIAGFGTSGSWQIGRDGSTIEYGPATEEFYNYLRKMREWYAAGYIYQDFASRTNDLFYLPNTSLTYGGGAGVWMGLLGQTGTAMSLPEYGLNVDVRPITAPLDTAHGITEKDASFYIFSGVASMPFCISTACDESKIARILTVFDYLFSDEGAMLRNQGLNAEQAADDPIYQGYSGMEKGAYWYDDEGNWYINETFSNATDNFDPNSFFGNRLPGKPLHLPEPVNAERTAQNDMEDHAGEVWITYGRERQIPSGATMNAEESKKFNAVYTPIVDYVNSMVPKFIMGTEELTEETFQSYVDQLTALGVEDANDAYRSALGRYNAR